MLVILATLFGFFTGCPIGSFIGNRINDKRWLKEFKEANRLRSQEILEERELDRLVQRAESIADKYQ